MSLMSFKFNFVKSKNIILYVASLNDGRIDLHYLFKVLYAADKEHLARFGRPVSGDPYYALKDGPVPTNTYDYLKEVRNGDEFDDDLKVEGAFIFTEGKPDLDELSDTELECINNALSRVSKNFVKRRADSHDLAYNRAWKKENNSVMNLFDIAEAGGANQEMKQYISEWLELDNICLHE